MTAADFPADHRKPNRASRSLRPFLRKIARDVHTATVDFPARHPGRNYSPRPRTTLLNNYVHCPHPLTPHFFGPLGVPRPTPTFGRAESKCHPLHDPTQNHRRGPMAICSRDQRSHDPTQARMMRKSQMRNASPLASGVTQCSISRKSERNGHATHGGNESLLEIPSVKSALVMPMECRIP
jgi:hypothetical protein